MTCFGAKNETLKTLMSSPRGVEECNRILKAWNEDDGRLFDGATVDVEIRETRMEFIAGKGREVMGLSIDIVSTELELIRILMRKSIKIRMKVLFLYTRKQSVSTITHPIIHSNVDWLS